ncbi:MAG: hypothetical protein OEQ13_13155 [Acidobacteriota bacterium]|nr:hypothetical protein [Acidobacteriota bacterium]
MNRALLLLSAVLALAACMIASVAVSFAENDDESVTLTGEIEAAEYDESGDVRSVMIYDSEWGSVLVSRSEKGKELLGHIGSVVTLQGKIMEMDEESEYRWSIDVRNFTVNTPAEHDDDEEWDPGDEE